MEKECVDKMILALRNKYREKLAQELPVGKEIQAGASSIPLRREEIFRGKYTMLLPETIRDLDRKKAAVKYRSLNRPQVIKSDSKGDVSFTFSIIPSDEREEIQLNRLKKIQDDMKKIWKQNVFYDMGEVTSDTFSIAWMDFKSFCLNGSLYSMLFLFDMEEETVLGNFHCVFSEYDVWKPVVLKLLTTIQTK